MPVPDPQATHSIVRLPPLPHRTNWESDAAATRPRWAGTARSDMSRSARGSVRKGEQVRGPFEEFVRYRRGGHGLPRRRYGWRLRL